MSVLKITSEKLKDQTTVLRLSGEFENSAALGAKSELLEYAQKESGKNLLLDFGEIHYIDSAGIGILLEMAKIALSRNLEFGLLNVAEPVKKVLTITKVDKILKIY